VSPSESTAAPASPGTAPPTKAASVGGDVLKLVSGTTAAQLLAILISPILTRLYGPQAFGMSALFGSLTGILGAISCMRYEPSIMLPEKDEEAVNLLGVCLVFVALVTAATVPLIWFSGPVLRLLKADQLKPHLWLMPPAVLAAGLYLALNYWSSRTKRFGRLSITRVTSSVTTAAAQFGAAFAGRANGGSLIGASVLGSSLATGVLGWQVWRDDHRLFRRSVSAREMWLGLKRHHRFPLFGTWSILLNILSWQMPTFFLSAYFSSAVVGYYALGTRLLRLPMDLIGNAIGMVFFERAAKARIGGTLPQLVEQTFRRLVNIGLFPLLILTFIGRDLFVLVFGAKWAEAGVYSQILSVWMFFWFISSPLITLFSVLEKQKYGLVFNVIIFSSRLLALWVGCRLGNARLALLLFGLSGLLVYGGMCLTLMAAAGYPWASSTRVILASLWRFLPAGAVLLAVLWIGAPVFVSVAVASGFLALHAVHIVRTDVEVSRMLQRLRPRNAA
jgi:O-antigen/teichoic acid export membrane protein